MKLLNAVATKDFLMFLITTLPSFATPWFKRKIQETPNGVLGLIISAILYLFVALIWET